MKHPSAREGCRGHIFICHQFLDTGSGLYMIASWLDRFEWIIRILFAMCYTAGHLSYETLPTVGHGLKRTQVTEKNFFGNLLEKIEIENPKSTGGI